MTLIQDPIPADYSQQIPVLPDPEPGDRLTAWGARLDQAIKGIQDLDPESRAAAQEFSLALDSLSKTALTAIVRTLKADPRGKELLFDLVDDPAVRMLLGMHGIIRVPDPEQADRVRSGIGLDGSVAPDPHAGQTKVNGKAFVSLEAMFRGPQSQQGHACGCGGDGDACVCGGH